jgi:excisionase family DNA binding protein
VTERLLNAAEVAERLSVPETWVRAETRAGRMPHLELGRYRRYDWGAVTAWLVEQRAGQWRKHRPRLGSVQVGGPKSSGLDS